MASTRFAGTKGGILIAAALSATLSGCASVEYNKLADGKNRQVVPMPAQASETAYAGPLTAPAGGPTVEAAAIAAGVPLPTPNPNNPQMAMMMQPAPMVAAAATGVSGQPPLGTQPLLPGQTSPVAMPQAGAVQVAMANPVSTNPLAAAEQAQGMELAYATPTLVAVPQPRPDIIAAANSIPTAGGPDAPAPAQVNAPVNPRAALLQQRLAALDPPAQEINPLIAAVPTPRPDVKPMGLEAYANAPDMMAMDAYDTSAPKEITKEPGLAPSGKLQELISKYAALYQVPEALVHRVVRRESMYNPNAYSRGNYGLMQIRYNTAKSLGYDGPPAGLFDAETNLKYAVKYLRGAFMVADNNHDHAVRLYARGYYYDAKRKGLLAQVQ